MEIPRPRCPCSTWICFLSRASLASALLANRRLTRPEERRLRLGIPGGRDSGRNKISLTLKWRKSQLRTDGRPHVQCWPQTAMWDITSHLVEEAAPERYALIAVAYFWFARRRSLGSSVAEAPAADKIQLNDSPIVFFVAHKCRNRRRKANQVALDSGAEGPVRNEGKVHL